MVRTSACVMAGVSVFVANVVMELNTGVLLQELLNYSLNLAARGWLVADQGNNACCPYLLFQRKFMKIRVCLAGGGPWLAIQSALFIRWNAARHKYGHCDGRVKDKNGQERDAESRAKNEPF